MKLFAKALIPAAMVAALTVSGAANANLATWTVNYQDSITALGYGSTSQPQSNLTDEYKYTAESIVAFMDNDNSGGISAGDTYDDFVLYRIDQLFLGGATNSDLDTFTKDAQISGIVVAEGTQIDALNYTVDSASIGFWFDSVNDVSGTDALFGGPLTNFTDGTLVQSGVGTGAGVNGALIPDGAINIDFQLTDLLAGENGPFELFNPFADLDRVTFGTDSNNQQCAPGGASCNSSVAALAAFFGLDLDPVTGPYDFFFHTKSDGSATKTIPEPASIALLSLGLLGFGAARRRSRKA